MLLASADALPRSASTQDLRFMGGSLSPGYKKSISLGKYESLSVGYLIWTVQTVFETRRSRLKSLVDQYGSVAALNRAIGWEDNNARLYQIHNRSIRADRGTPYELGDATAREIEQKLSLEVGWMDTPLGLYSALDERIAHALKVMEAMPEWQLDQAVKIIDTIAEPAPPHNGTAG